MVRGVQLSLGILLAIEGAKMASSWWLLGIVSIIIVLILRANRYAPAALVLVILGIVIMAIKGQLAGIHPPSLYLPQLTMFDFRQMWPALRDGGLAQIPLTATNAVIATSVLISQYWPHRRVTERQLSFNMGAMNVVLPFFGGIPLCHGAGGLASQYYFGARTGDANILEGLIEVSLGLFFAGSIVTIFAVFPVAILGAMMFLVGIELLKFARELRMNRELLPVAVTVAGSVFLNIAVGFVAGLATYYLLFRNHKDLPNH